MLSIWSLMLTIICKKRDYWWCEGFHHRLGFSFKFLRAASCPQISFRISALMSDNRDLVSFHLRLTFWSSVPGIKPFSYTPHVSILCSTATNRNLFLENFTTAFQYFYLKSLLKKLSMNHIPTLFPISSQYLSSDYSLGYFCEQEILD